MCSSNKRNYRSYNEAYESLERIRFKFPFKKRGECRIYQCKECGMYHLTSSSRIKPPRLLLKKA